VAPVMLSEAKDLALFYFRENRFGPSHPSAFWIAPAITAVSAFIFSSDSASP